MIEGSSAEQKQTINNISQAVQVCTNIVIVCYQDNGCISFMTLRNVIKNDYARTMTYGANLILISPTLIQFVVLNPFNFFLRYEPLNISGSSLQTTGILSLAHRLYIRPTHHMKHKSRQKEKQLLGLNIFKDKSSWMSTMLFA